MLKIRKIGDPVLRSKANKVNEINEDTKELVNKMIDTMYEAEGIGLAAPQVGILQAIIIVDLGNKLYKVINPEIIHKEGKTILEEGCLSIPEENGQVIRAKKIKLKGLNLEGKEIIIEAEDLLARAFQHEIDHLEGILFVDKKLGL